LFEFRKSPPPQRAGARDTLFGDIPLARLLAMIRPEALAVEPWKTFHRARVLSEEGDATAAIQNLHRVLETPRLESRLILQTWHALRALGEKPQGDAEKQLLGVVVEVGLPRGLDLVAAYADHSARYFNFSGAGVVWERPNAVLDAPVDEVLEAGATVVRQIGLWEKNRPSAPGTGEARINLLTASGLHFGEGPYDVLEKDRMAGPVLNAALNLMQRLVEIGRPQGAHAAR